MLTAISTKQTTERQGSKAFIPDSVSMPFWGLILKYGILSPWQKIQRLRTISSFLHISMWKVLPPESLKPGNQLSL